MDGNSLPGSAVRILVDHENRLYQLVRSICAEFLMPGLFDISKETILIAFDGDRVVGVERLALHDRQRGDGGWRGFADVKPRA
jgi:hypothetical protein